MAVKIETLEFEIQQGSNTAAQGVDALTASLGRLRTATRGTNALLRTTRQLRQLNTALQGFQSTTLVRIANAMASLSRLQNIRIPASFGRSLSVIAGATQVLTDEGVARFERLAHALQQIGSVGNIRIPNLRQPNPGNQQGPRGPQTSGQGRRGGELQEAAQQAGQAAGVIRTVTEVFGEMGAVVSTVAAVFSRVAMVIGIVIRVIRIVTSVIKRFLGLVNKLLTPVRKLASAMGQAFVAPFKKIGKSVGDAFKKVNEFFSSIKRIALYRLIRTAIAWVTQALREGINNLYQWSKLLNGDFAKSMDKIATSALYVKNSLAAMVAPVINAVAPVIDMLGDKVVALMNKVNEALARLFGQQTYTVAKKISAEYAKIKSYLIGIDELNVIEDEKPPVNEMFEDLPLTGVSEFVDRLRQAIEEGDWEALGRTLGEKFNEIIEKIDWVEIGKTIGYWLNAAIQTFYYFLDEADFEKLGNHIAEMFNEIIKGVDWNIVGRLLVKQFTVLWDLAIGFFEALDYAELAKAITNLLVGIFSELREWFDEKDWKQLAEVFNQALADLFANLDFKEIGKTIGEFLKELFVDFKTWLEHVDWDQLGKDIFQAIKNFFEGFDFGGVLKEFFSLLGTAAKAAKDLLKPFWDGIVEWWNEHIKADSFKQTIKNLGEYLVKFVDEYVLTPFMAAFFSDDSALQNGQKSGLGKLKEIGENILLGILEGFGNWVKEHLLEWLAKMFFSPFVVKLCELFGIMSPAKEMIPIGEDILRGILEGMINIMKNIGEWIKTHILNPFKDAFRAVFLGGLAFIPQNVGKVLKLPKNQEVKPESENPVKHAIEEEDQWETFTDEGALKEIEGVGKKVIEAFNNGLSSMFQTIIDTLLELKTTVVRKIEEIVEGVKSLFRSFDGFEKILKPIEELLKNILMLLSNIAKKWKIQLEINDILGYLSSVLGMLETIAGQIYTVVLAAVETVSGVVASAKGQLESIAGKVYTAVVTATETVSGVVVSAKAQLESIAGKVYTAVVTATETASGVVASAKAQLESIGGKVYTAVINATDTVSGAVNSAKSKLEGVAAGIYQATISARDSVSNAVSTAKSKLEGVASRLYQATVSAKDSVSSGVNSAKSALQNVAGGLYQAAITAKDSASGVIDSVKSKLSSIPTSVAVAITVTVAVAGAIAALSGLGGIGALAGLAFAKGGVFTQPVFFHATGALVDKPVMFHAFGGTHVMGEAGREAILPLQSHTEWMDEVAERTRNVMSEDADLSKTTFYAALSQFFGEYLEPVMSNMDANMQRQADKDERPVVKIGNRDIRTSYDTQVKADGYNFTR